MMTQYGVLLIIVFVTPYEVDIHDCITIRLAAHNRILEWNCRRRKYDWTMVESPATAETTATQMTVDHQSLSTKRRKSYRLDKAHFVFMLAMISSIESSFSSSPSLGAASDFLQSLRFLSRFFAFRLGAARPVKQEWKSGTIFTTASYNWVKWLASCALPSRLTAQRSGRDLVSSRRETL